MVTYGKADIDYMVHESYTAKKRNYWKPQMGDNIIRILPPWSTTQKSFYHFYKVHFIEKGKGTVKVECCNGCYICRMNKLLWDKQYTDQAKKIRATKRWVVNILDMKDISAGVQIFEFGKQIWDNVEVFIHKGVDVSDLITGKNMYLKKMVSDEKAHIDSKNVKYVVMFEESSALPQDVVGKLGELYDLTLLNKSYTEHEQRQLLMDILPPGIDDEVDKSDGENVTAAPIVTATVNTDYDKSTCKGEYENCPRCNSCPFVDRCKIDMLKKVASKVGSK